MFSNPATPRYHRLVLLGLLLSMGFVWACGHKKRPIPPPRMIPATSFAFRGHLRGTEAVVRFPYPITNYRGATLDGISKVEVYRMTQVIPAEAVELLDTQLIEHEQKLLEYNEELAAWRERNGIVAPPTVDETGAVVPPGMTPEQAEAARQSGVEPIEQALSEPPEPLEEEAPPPIEVESDADDEDADDEATTEDEAGEGEDGEDDEDDDPMPVSPGPAPKLANLVYVDPRELERDGDIVLTLEGDELAAAILGTDVMLRLPLDAPPPEADEETVGGVLAYVFAVRTSSLKGLPSGLSNTIKVIPRETPAAPSDLETEPMPKGVKLSWTAEPPPENGFKIYRREAQVRVYGDPVATLPSPEITTWTDWTAILGTRYIYGVAAVGTIDPLIESPISAERELLYRDRFPPTVPTNVVAFPEPGQVRVLWDLNDEEDLAGFEVLRRIGGEVDATPVRDDLVTVSEYVDADIRSRQVYFYSVIAVDEKGNRSEPSAEVEVRIP